MLYIDNDQLAATHARALMTGRTTHTAEIDLTDTTAVFDAITTTLDPIEPIALCLSGTVDRRKVMSPMSVFRCWACRLKAVSYS